MTKNLKSQKPIEYDISFKYLCPSCSGSHWLFLREVRVEGFKIVCECGDVFEPLPIADITINYSEVKHEEKSAVIDEKTLSVAKDSLIRFGYSESESVEMINKAYENLECNDAVKLVKYAITNFGVSYV